MQSLKLLWFSVKYPDYLATTLANFGSIGSKLNENEK